MRLVERSASGTLTVALGQYSTAGRKPVNQDSMAARIPEGLEAAVKGIAFAVADGISTSEMSQVASEIAVKTLMADYYATPEAWTVKTSAARVIEATNSWLFAQNRHMRTSDLNQGLVCTLSALILKAREAHIFHVGDSRVARLTANGLEPLTQDHTTVLSADTQYLSRALGAQHRVDIDYHTVPLLVGDVYLLTTDGVHDFVDAAVVQRVLSANVDLDQAAQAITEAALAAGSGDNLTVQVLRIDELPDTRPSVTGTGNELPIPLGLAPGDHLDGLQLLRELHNTVRSRVFLAADAAGSKVVVKVPGTEAAESAESRQRFLFEEWIARRVNSAHIVKAALGVGPRSASYVALQWIDGMTLRQWMTDNPNPEIDTVRAMVEQIVGGLRALHRQEVIHQDLRPENIMVDRQGTAIIIDLGSAAVAGVAEATSGLLGALPGTFQYTAPEYLSGDTVSWRSDQYSLAVIAYEMLTGTLPYGAQVARIRNRKDQQQLKYRPADSGERAPPAWVDFALARACHRDPTRRYDALSEFLTDLRSPSSAYTPRASKPLLERSPLRFWQGIVVIQLLVIIYLLGS